MDYWMIRHFSGSLQNAYLGEELKGFCVIKIQFIFSFTGAMPLWPPDQGLCPWAPMGAQPPDAPPFRRNRRHCLHLCMMTPSLYVTRSATSIQCKSSCKIRVRPWSNFLVSLTTGVAAFITRPWSCGQGALPKAPWSWNLFRSWMPEWGCKCAQGIQ